MSDHETDRRSEQQQCYAVCPPFDQRVQNVPAVELSDWHQVQRGYKNSDPASKQPSVLRDVVMLGYRS